jgi:cell division GTPase FtsZ
MTKLDCFLSFQVPGLVNVDFADVHAIMQNAGSSLMSIGTATGITWNHFPSKKYISLLVFDG